MDSGSTDYIYILDGLIFILALRLWSFSVFTLLTTALAANWAALGICYNTGQDCTAGSRVYVQESVYDKFIDLLVAKVKSTVIGDGFNEESTGGPVVGSGAALS